MHAFRPLAVAAVLGAVFAPHASAASAEPATGKTVDGIRCESAEGSVFHIHQHLAIYAHGKPLALAEDIGRPAVTPCLYWLHTHTADGIVHVEAPVFRAFTLGQLFDLWGQPLSRTRVAGATVASGAMRVYVDGNRFAGDPRAIELAQHADVVIEAGPPYLTPVPFTDWQGQ